MKIAFPYKVKHCGVDYAPNSVIEVSEQDAQECIAMGAVAIPSTQQTEDEKPKTTRKRKG